MRNKRWRTSYCKITNARILRALAIERRRSLSVANSPSLVSHTESPSVVCFAHRKQCSAGAGNGGSTMSLQEALTRLAVVSVLRLRWPDFAPKKHHPLLAEPIAFHDRQSAAVLSRRLAAAVSSSAFLTPCRRLYETGRRSVLEHQCHSAAGSLYI